MTPNRFVPALLASTLLLAASAALAQPSAPVAPVTVHGAAPPAMVEEQTHSFVQSFAAPTAELDQIARWRDPVCIKAVGEVTPAQAAQVEARIGGVAQEVGLRVLPAGCTPNIQVVFSGRPQVVIDKVAVRREEVLGYYHRHENKRLKTVTHPVQAWYVTATGGSPSNGVGMATLTIEGPTGPPVMGVQGHEEVIDDPENRMPMGCGDSPHFTSCMRSLLKNVLVVVDTSTLQGKDVGLLSDYLVMLTLAQPRTLDGCAALPSVVDLLASHACPNRDLPDGLTAGDAAYLTALYQADPKAKRWAQEGDIANRMADILMKADAQRR
jgi:hypothetical protein